MAGSNIVQFDYVGKIDGVGEVLRCSECASLVLKGDKYSHKKFHNFVTIEDIREVKRELTDINKDINEIDSDLSQLGDVASRLIDDFKDFQKIREKVLDE